MYSPPVPGKKQTIKQVAVYALMTLSVIVVVSILILIMLGYRLDRKTGTLEQGGLVQLDSTPSGANLMINGTRLGATTGTKTTLAPGQHMVSMSRSGYTPWQKTVEVKSGTILWLNYARLLPLDRPVENVATLPGVTSSIPSPNRQRYVMTTEKASPSILLVNINTDTPEVETLTIPETSYTKSINPETESFTLTSWDPSNRYVLLEHIYDDKSEWLVVDVENIAETKNITDIFDIAITQPQFSREDTNVLFALINGDVRRIDIRDSTISAPLVRNVAEFSFYDQSVLIYVTNVSEETKSRTVGYKQKNASEPRVIRNYSDDGTIPLRLALGKYYNQTYVGIAYGTTVDILSGSLPRSDSEDPLTLTAVATMSTPEPISFLSNRTDGRFFVAQHENSYSVYDLELQKATTTTLRGEASQTKEIRWIDGYNAWSSLDGVLRFYEFDGANQNDIMPIVSGQNPALSPNDRFLYAPTIDDAGEYHLSRVRLIL